jgi:hypothetical protein
MIQIRKLSYKIIQSSTILLPLWKRLVRELCNLAAGLLPRDVRTRWNSTFDMLEGALKFKPVIKKLTEDSDNDLREYELTKEEWEVLVEMRDTLKVSNHLPHVILAVTARCTAASVSSSALTLCNSCHGQDRSSLCNRLNGSESPPSDQSRSCCCQENSEPILRSQRSLRRLPNCNEYVLTSPYLVVINSGNTLQSFTQSTNCVTSRKQNGKTSGL